METKKKKEVNIVNDVDEDVQKEEEVKEYSDNYEYSGEPKWGTEGNNDYSMKPKCDPKTKFWKHYDDKYYGQLIWGLDVKNWTDGIPIWGAKGNIDYAIEPNGNRRNQNGQQHQSGKENLHGPLLHPQPQQPPGPPSQLQPGPQNHMWPPRFTNITKPNPRNIKKSYQWIC